jgi:hypothetical protein
VKYRDGEEGETRYREGAATRQCAFSDAQQRLDDQRDDRGLEPQEQTLHERVLLPEYIGDGQRHDRNETWQNEQQASDEAAARPMEQPADVGGELLRFGAGQQHAIAQCVQKALFADPALFIDQDAVHDGDLSGGAAKRQQADA